MLLFSSIGRFRQEHPPLPVRRRHGLNQFYNVTGLKPNVDRRVWFRGANDLRFPMTHDSFSDG